LRYSKKSARKPTWTPEAADLLNDRMLPCFDEQGVTLLRVLTDRR
jgi:hypothetical protein